MPFVERQARLIEYSMSPEEQTLYDDVTAWLMDPYLLLVQWQEPTAPGALAFTVVWLPPWPPCHRVWRKSLNVSGKTLQVMET